MLSIVIDEGLPPPVAATCLFHIQKIPLFKADTFLFVVLSLRVKRRSITENEMKGKIVNWYRFEWHFPFFHWLKGNWKKRAFLYLYQCIGWIERTTRKSISRILYKKKIYNRPVGLNIIHFLLRTGWSYFCVADLAVVRE